jgi:hypothetical protein
MDEGHQQKYDDYEAQEQLTHNAIAHEKGEYEYVKPMQEVEEEEPVEAAGEEVDDGEEEAEEAHETSDMDIEDDDDDD